MKLNLGCGTDTKKGYLNVDIVKLPGVDKVVNLNTFPYPFKSNSITEIYSNHVLDHLDDPTAVLREWHRILKPGGKIILILPHFSSATAYWGGVRKHQFSWITFKRYQKTSKRAYYFDFHFKRITIDFQFQTSPWWIFWPNHLLRAFANWQPYLYEMTVLRAFPCITMQIELRK